MGDNTSVQLLPPPNMFIQVQVHMQNNHCTSVQDVKTAKFDITRLQKFDSSEFPRATAKE